MTTDCVNYVPDSNISMSLRAGDSIVLSRVCRLKETGFSCKYRDYNCRFCKFYKTEE